MKIARTAASLVGAVIGFYVGLGLAFEWGWPFGPSALTSAALGAVTAAAMFGWFNRPVVSIVGAVALGLTAGTVFELADADIVFAPIVGLAIVGYLTVVEHGA